MSSSSGSYETTSEDDETNNEMTTVMNNMALSLSCESITKSRNISKSNDRAVPDNSVDINNVSHPVSPNLGSNNISKVSANMPAPQAGRGRGRPRKSTEIPVSNNNPLPRRESLAYDQEDQPIQKNNLSDILANKKIQELEKQRNEIHQARLNKEREKHQDPHTKGPNVVQWNDTYIGDVSDIQHLKITEGLLKTIDKFHNYFPVLKETCPVKKFTVNTPAARLEEEIRRCKEVKSSQKALAGVLAIDKCLNQLTQYALIEYGIPAQGLCDVADVERELEMDCFKELAILYGDWMDVSPELKYIANFSSRIVTVIEQNSRNIAKVQGNPTLHTIPLPPAANENGRFKSL